MITLPTLLVIILVVVLLTYGGYGRSRWAWGAPGDIVAVLVVLLVVLLLVGRI
jgi:hypothetical protein